MKYFLSNKQITVFAETDPKGILVDGAPVIRKFMGQPIDNLIRWMKKFKEFRKVEL